MTRWEYKTLRFETFKLFESQLNYYGNEGWEAFSIVHNPNAPAISEKEQSAIAVDGLQGVRPLWTAILKRAIK
jgi:hypothetical protein